MIVALAMAAWAAVQGQSQPIGYLELEDDDAQPSAAVRVWCDAIRAASRGQWWG